MIACSVLLASSLLACGDDGEAAGAGDTSSGAAADATGAADTPLPAPAGAGLCTAYCDAFGTCPGNESCEEVCASDAGLSLFAEVEGCMGALEAFITCQVESADCETLATPEVCPPEFEAFANDCITPYCTDNPEADICVPPVTCEEDSCENGGVCSVSDDVIACDCEGTGYEGERCEEEVDDCSPDPCANGGECYDMHMDFGCACPAGYTGKTCDLTCAACFDEAVAGVCAEVWAICEAAPVGEDGIECISCVEAVAMCNTPGEPCPGPPQIGEFCDYDAAFAAADMGYCVGGECGGCP